MLPEFDRTEVTSLSTDRYVTNIFDNEDQHLASKSTQPVGRSCRESPKRSNTLSAENCSESSSQLISLKNALAKHTDERTRNCSSSFRSMEECNEDCCSRSGSGVPSDRGALVRRVHDGEPTASQVSVSVAAATQAKSQPRVPVQITTQPRSGDALIEHAITQARSGDALMEHSVIQPRSVATMEHSVTQLHSAFDLIEHSITQPHSADALVEHSATQLPETSDDSGRTLLALDANPRSRDARCKSFRACQGGKENPKGSSRPSMGQTSSQFVRKSLPHAQRPSSPSSSNISQLILAESDRTEIASPFANRSNAHLSRGNKDHHLVSKPSEPVGRKCIESVKCTSELSMTNEATGSNVARKTSVLLAQQTPPQILLALHSRLPYGAQDSVTVAHGHVVHKQNQSRSSDYALQPSTLTLFADKSDNLSSFPLSDSLCIDEPVNLKNIPDPLHRKMSERPIDERDDSFEFSQAYGGLRQHAIGVVASSECSRIGKLPVENDTDTCGAIVTPRSDTGEMDWSERFEWSE